MYPWISFSSVVYNSLLFLFVWGAPIQVGSRICSHPFLGPRGEHFLLANMTKCYRLFLCLFFPSPVISHFSKDPWFPVVGNGITDQELDASCTPCYHGVTPFKPFQLGNRTKLGNSYLYIHRNKHKHIHIFMDTSNSSPFLEDSFFFPSFHIYIFFL